jgi:DNA-binding LacI/PurR family transcriptional regulator
MTDRRHVGIRDVARAAGVSITTVSHALNEKGGVSEETRVRVRAVAEAMGYRPDPRGRHLASGRTGIVALTVSMPDGVHAPIEEFAHHASLIDGALKMALARGLALVIVPAGESTTWERLPLDGVIVVDPLPADLAVREMRDRSVPVVTVGRIPGDATEAPVVDNDFRTGTEMVLDHLAAAGARRIGLVAPGMGESYEVDSLEAYRAWCGAIGTDPWIERADDVDWASPRPWADLEAIGRRTAARLFARGDVPDAVYCLAEAFATGMLDEARSRGIDVPGDVMVASMSDVGQTGRADPPLTTLDLHPRDLGAAAAEMLADLVEGTARSPAPVTVPVTLVARASTARRRAARR